MMERPKRPYRNFAEFLVSIQIYWRQETRQDPFLAVEDLDCNLIKYPCRRCGGAGAIFILHPKGKGQCRSEVEDPCTACQGLGKATKKACQEEYRQVIARWKEEAGKYDRLKEVKRRVLKKLTEEEVQALKELGV